MSSITRRHFVIDSGKALAGTSALAAFLAACGGGSTDGSNEHLTLKYWVTNYQPGNATGKATQAALDAYKKNHSNLDFKVTGYTGDQAGFTKISQAVKGGSAVDLFRFPSDNLPLLIKQDLVTPIDSYLTDSDKADIYPDLLKAVSHGGKTYAWPLWVPPVGMYINKDILTERGLTEPSDNWTYEEFVELAKQMTFTRSDGTKVYGFTGVVDPDVVNTWPILMGDGGVPVSDDHKKYRFDQPEAISGLQKLVDLAQKHKVTPPDFGTQDADTISAGFSGKTYAMYPAPSGDSAGYKKTGVNFIVKPMPIMGRKKHFTVGGVGLVAVAKLKDENRAKAAMDLARFLTSADVEKANPGYYLAPGARKSIKTKDPISLFDSFVAYTYMMPLIPEWSQVRTLIHTQIQNAILGKATAEEAFKAPAKEINSILGGSSY